MLSKSRRIVLNIINKNDLLALLAVVGMFGGLVLSPYYISMLVLAVLTIALVLDFLMKAPSFAFFLGTVLIMFCFSAPAYTIAYII